MLCRGEIQEAKKDGFLVNKERLMFPRNNGSLIFFLLFVKGISLIQEVNKERLMLSDFLLSCLFCFVCRACCLLDDDFLRVCFKHIFIYP